MTDPTLHQRFSGIPDLDQPLVDTETGELLGNGHWHRFFVMLSRLLPASIVPGTARNLAVARLSGTTLQLTADAILTKSFLAGGSGRPGQQLSLGFNGGAIGPGGMDVGALPAAGFLSLYLITGQQVPPALLGTIASQTSLYGGTALPVGYSSSALVSLWPCAAGPSLVAAAQVDREILLPAANALAAGAAVAATLVNLAAAVPLAARRVRGVVSNGTAAVVTKLFADAAGTLAEQDSPAGGRCNFDMPLATAQSLWYLNSAGGGAASVTITAFSF